jgi:peptidoglycan/LPS O-acetylase OafA/YrhL
MQETAKSRHNAFAFLRFILASLVIFAHSSALGDFPDDLLSIYSSDRLGPGNVAVFGFFFISGFLVTKSYLRLRSLPRFLWHRALRIYPAFWVCLVVTAFGFAAFAFAHEKGTLSGFVGASDDPLAFLKNNWTLAIRQWGIDRLLSTNPFPSAFNGSLWTLEAEFRCYLGVALLGIAGLLRGARWTIGVLVLVLWAPLVWSGFYVHDWPHAGIIADLFPSDKVLEQCVYFALGCAALLYRDHIRLDPRIAGFAFCSIFAALKLPYCSAFAPFALSYLVYYAAFRIPIYDFDRFGDFSYGIYIYAFPVQQVFAMLGVQRYGFWPFMLLSLLATLPLAALSWKLVEEPALRLKDRSFGRFGQLGNHLSLPLQVVDARMPAQSPEDDRF